MRYRGYTINVHKHDWTAQGRGVRWSATVDGYPFNTFTIPYSHSREQAVDIAQGWVDREIDSPAKRPRRNPAAKDCAHSHPPEVPVTPCEAKPTETPPAETPAAPEASHVGLPFVRVAVDPASGKASLVPVDAVSFEALLVAAPKLDDARKAYDYLWPWYSTRDQEVFLALLFDVRHQLRGIAEIGVGQRSKVGIGLDDLVRVVTVAGAERFIVWHQHPSGVATPSADDKRLHKSIRKAFKAFPNIVLCDFCVAAREGFHSAYEKKLFRL